MGDRRRGPKTVLRHAAFAGSDDFDSSSKSVEFHSADGNVNAGRGNYRPLSNYRNANTGSYRDEKFNRGGDVVRKKETDLSTERVSRDRPRNAARGGSETSGYSERNERRNGVAEQSRREKGVASRNVPRDGDTNRDSSSRPHRTGKNRDHNKQGNELANSRTDKVTDLTVQSQLKCLFLDEKKYRGRGIDSRIKKGWGRQGNWESKKYWGENSRGVAEFDAARRGKEASRLWEEKYLRDKMADKSRSERGVTDRTVYGDRDSHTDTNRCDFRNPRRYGESYNCGQQGHGSSRTDRVTESTVRSQLECLSLDENKTVNCPSPVNNCDTLLEEVVGSEFRPSNEGFTPVDDFTIQVQTETKEELSAENAGSEPCQQILMEKMRYLESKISEIEDSNACAICMERKRNVVFLCGHGTCSECADTLDTCHMCRKSITNKIQIY